MVIFNFYIKEGGLFGEPSNFFLKYIFQMDIGITKLKNIEFAYRKENDLFSAKSDEKKIRIFC